MALLSTIHWVLSGKQEDSIIVDWYAETPGQ